MCFFQSIDEPLLALSNVCGAWIMRSVSEPEGNVAAVETLCNLDAVECVLHRAKPNCCVGIAKRTVFVLLILKEIGIDCTGRNTTPCGELLDLIGTLDTARAIP